MTYQRPEVLRLGSASLLIQGEKSQNSELESLMAKQDISDSQLDD